MGNLEGKVAIVTGGISGLGLAITKKFLQDGAKVVIADISENGSEIAKELWQETLVRYYKADVTNEEEVRELIKQTVEWYGSVDIVVANAGIPSDTPIHQETAHGWQRVVDVNLTGVFFTNKFGIEQMLKQKTGGAIINVASILGLVGDPDAISYSATKGGIVNMTRSLGVAYAKEGIRVNAIAPGYVRTPLLEQLDQEKVAGISKLHPIGRIAEAEEIATVASFLASDEASFIVGATIPVDGGYTAK